MSDQTKPRVVSELRATAQLMTLEPGVFCVFHQGPVAVDASGLPGVRISLPPSSAPDSVQISTFRDDGWLGGADSAALIRINGGRPGQVLVTVYQAPNGTDAPRLQVVRLTDVPAPAAPALPAAQPAGIGAGAGVGAAMVPGAAGGERPPVPSTPQPPADQAEVAVHINRMGDVLALFGHWAGERGSKRWIEGFALSPRAGLSPHDIEYQAVLGRDWLSPWSEGGQYCGSRGMSLPLLGLRVRLRGEAAQRFDLALEASFVNGTSIGPVAAGEACETSDLAALEAFRLVVTPRVAADARPEPGAKPRTKTARAARQPEPKPASPKPAGPRPVVPKSVVPKSVVPKPTAPKPATRRPAQPPEPPRPAPRRR